MDAVFVDSFFMAKKVLTLVNECVLMRSRCGQHGTTYHTAPPRASKKTNPKQNTMNPILNCYKRGEHFVWKNAKTSAIVILAHRDGSIEWAAPEIENANEIVADTIDALAAMSEL